MARAGVIDALPLLLALGFAAAAAPRESFAAVPAVDVVIDDVGEQNLDQVLNALVVNVASKIRESTRETSGIITIITRDEIVASGARDLYELLHLVPGFAFGVDVEGVVGVGFRGLWGHEGKVLLLVDGLEMNETLYSTTQFGNHIPANHIQRLEIIRGPGSAVYGGYAELAVINVITREANDLNGLAASEIFSLSARGTPRWNVAISGGGAIDSVPGLSASVEAAIGRAQRSDSPYVNQSGDEYPMAGRSGIELAMVNAAVTYKDLRLRFLFDDHANQLGTDVKTTLDQPVAQGFRAYHADLSYVWQVKALKGVLSPRINYKRQTPWQVSDSASEFFYDKTAERLLGGLTLTSYPIDWLDLLVGVEGALERARLNNLNLVGLQSLFTGDKVSVLYGTVTGFAQARARTPIANITLGARYQYHTQYGGAFVPRAGVTRVIGRFNLKLLFSQAFRNPGIENININPDIRPEKTTVAEAEVGFQATDNIYLNANAFWMLIDQPIVYLYDEATMTESYKNSGKTGTTGVEAEFRMKFPWGFATLNYSFYHAAGQNQVDLYKVEGRKDVLVGMPAHKVALNSSFHLWRDRLLVNVSGTFLSERFAYLRVDDMGVPILGSEGPVVLVNASLTARDVGTRGLDFSIGAMNLLDSRYRLAQPYDGGHAPLPTIGREIYLRLIYEFKKRS